MSANGISESGELGENETAFGLAVGGGLALAVSPRARLFVEPMYRIAFTDEESTKYVPIKIGVVIGN